LVRKEAWFEKRLGSKRDLVRKEAPLSFGDLVRL